MLLLMYFEIFANLNLVLNLNVNLVLGKLKSGHVRCTEYKLVHKKCKNLVVHNLNFFLSF